MGLDELLSDFLLGGAGVGGGVGHDETGAAFFVERGIEKLNPEIVALSVRGDRRDSGGSCRRIFEPILIDGVDVERRIREDEVEVSGAVVLVFVVGVRLADIAFEAVDREVHARERDVAPTRSWP